jgi:hypothetical protein
VSGAPFVLTLSARSRRVAQTCLIVSIKVHLVPPFVNVCP